mmetsp:Transcript_3584/g.10316  ORF Transcript_3584/g.10316 Transcript_3584/m.10316 type:complete len:227 (-) Transcript_3584:304-984(-)
MVVLCGTPAEHLPTLLQKQAAAWVALRQKGCHARREGQADGGLCFLQKCARGSGPVSSSRVTSKPRKVRSSAPTSGLKTRLPGTAGRWPSFQDGALMQGAGVPFRFTCCMEVPAAKGEVRADTLPHPSFTPVFPRPPTPLICSTHLWPGQGSEGLAAKPGGGRGCQGSWSEGCGEGPPSQDSEEGYGGGSGAAKGTGAGPCTYDTGEFRKQQLLYHRPWESVPPVQ